MKCRDDVVATNSGTSGINASLLWQPINGQRPHIPENEMKLLTIHSSDLPAIADIVKECVNSGRWVLFTSQTENRHAETEYFLQTEQAVFELNSEGGVVAVRGDGELSPEMDAVVHFGNLPQPPSLSNGAVPAYSLNQVRLAA